MGAERNNVTRTLVLTLVTLALIVVGVMYNYYTDENRKNDPRVVPAKKLYSQYNSLAQKQAYPAVFALLDSVEAIYSQVPHYQKSFEIGVVENNRSAAWLSIALQRDMEDGVNHPAYADMAKDSLLRLSEISANKAIAIYESWIRGFQDLDEEQIRERIRPSFYEKFNVEDEDDQEMYLGRRVDELVSAQLETKRRLSVSYTNLGIVFRHREEYEQAAKYYLIAIDLWDKNLTAENNLNVLLGKPMKKRNFIERLFPADKEKE